MSKSRPFFCLAFAIILAAAVSALSASAELNVLVDQNGTKARVEVEFTDAFGQPPRNLSFIRSIAGITLPAGRIEALEASVSGRSVEIRKFSDGEYVVAGEYDRIRFVIELRSTENASARAHFSWFDDGRGAFMLRDLLPDLNRRASACLIFRSGVARKVYSVAPPAPDGSYEFADYRDAIVFADDVAETSRFEVAGTKVVVLKSGEWQTGTEKIVSAATNVIRFYSGKFGRTANSSIIISLAKFPPGTPVGRWRAETRGGVVTVLSSEANFQMQSEQKLMEQLRHELFHLWFPGSLNLTGNYDWFFEGFALYASLRAALDMKQIRFDDFLETVSRASKIDTLVRRRKSLLEDSENRWSGNDLTVYARGLLIAFSTDVRLISTNGNYSVFEFLRDIAIDHGRASNPVGASEALAAAFGSRPALAEIWKESIAGTSATDLLTQFETVGLEVAQPDGILRVKSKLNGRQKDLLDKLGYNSWRKKSD